MGKCALSAGKDPETEIINTSPDKFRGKFKKLCRIGVGIFCIVWKVSKNERVYAMKEISKHRLLSINGTRFALQELQLLSCLSHPLIVNIHYAFQTPKHLYLVMDYMSGGDLRYSLLTEKNYFTETQLKFFISCLILALEYLHENEIIHSDIKPENLVFDYDGYLKLTDFGTAKKIDSKKNWTGTFIYMAPEILFKKSYGFASDFYSMGIIMYEVMVKKIPYFGKDRAEVQKAFFPPFIQKADGWTNHAIDLANALLVSNPNKRLGYNGIREIKSHPWFNDVNWNDLYNRRAEPPYRRSGHNNYDFERVNADLYDNCKAAKDNSKFVDYYFDKDAHNCDN